MERHVRYVWIGCIFFITLILAVCFVLWLNRFEANSSKYAHYYAYSADEVVGIGTNTPVRYKGISVGRVLGVRFKDIKEGVIELEMLLDSELIVRENAKVVIASAGLAGANYLSLIQGEGKALEPDESGRKVLRLDKGSMEKIFSKAGELSEDIGELLKNLNHTFNEENLANIAKLLESLKESSESLSSISAQMDKNLQRGEYNLREILSPTVLQLQGSLQDMSRFFNSASRFVDKVEKNPYDSLFGKSEGKSSRSEKERK